MIWIYADSASRHAHHYGSNLASVVKCVGEMENLYVILQVGVYAHEGNIRN